jgi:hypothetical protein
MLKTEKQVQEYAKIFSDLLSGAENLAEFAKSLPAPDEDGNVAKVNGHQLQALQEAHKAFAEVWESISEYQDAAGGTIQVTVSLEPGFHHGASWVARDRRGAWRSYCLKHFATDAAQAATMMFHLSEVASVEQEGEKAKVGIYE